MLKRLIDSEDQDGFTPLVNNHAAIRTLLQRGADLNKQDAEKQGVLHVAAVLGDLTTLSILFSADVRVAGSKDEDIFGFNPLQIFDIRRAEYVAEDAATRAHCREMLLEVSTRQDVDPTTTGESSEIEDPEETASEEESDVFYDLEEPLGPI